MQYPSLSNSLAQYSKSQALQQLFMSTFEPPRQNQIGKLPPFSTIPLHYTSALSSLTKPNVVVHETQTSETDRPLTSAGLNAVYQQRPDNQTLHLMPPLPQSDFVHPAMNTTFMQQVTSGSITTAPTDQVVEPSLPVLGQTTRICESTRLFTPFVDAFVQATEVKQCTNDDSIQTKVQVVKLADYTQQESAEEERSSSVTLEEEESPASSEKNEPLKGCQQTMQATPKRKRKPNCKNSGVTKEPTVEKKKKNTRLGCTETDLQAYVDQSNVQIEQWTKELENYKKGQGPEVQKNRDMLRNKISALRSRMKRKQLLFRSTEKIGDQYQKFTHLMDILQEELSGKSEAKFARKIKKRIDQALSKNGLNKPKTRTLKESAEKFLEQSNANNK